jgi:hypothetical protein
MDYGSVNVEIKFMSKVSVLLCSFSQRQKMGGLFCFISPSETYILKYFCLCMVFMTLLCIETCVSFQMN